MERILLYGAGSAGQNYLKNHPNLNVIGYVDRDVSKQEKGFNGYPVYSIEEIKKKGFEKIIITSLYAREILQDLKLQGFDLSKVEVPPKTHLSYKMGVLEDKKFKSIVKESMSIINQEFQKEKIKYHYMYGTLLGLVRDGDLIPWDDDVDIVIPEKQKKLVESAMQKVVFRIEEIASISLEEYSDRISLRYWLENERVFSIDLYFYRVENQYYKRGRATLNIEHFLQQAWLNINGNCYPIPTNPEDILVEIYGESWITPKADFSSDEYMM